MRRCAALLLLVSASLPGCAGRGLTGWVWTGVVHEEPQIGGCPLRVRISPDGDVAVLYLAWVKRPHSLGEKLEFMGWLTHGTSPSPTPIYDMAGRGLVVPAAEMQKLLAAGSGGAVVVVGGQGLAKFVRPADPRSMRNFKESSVPGLAHWPEVLRHTWPPAARQVEARSDKVQFAYAKRGEADVSEGVGKARTVTVQIDPPTRSRPAVRGLPLRLLLTPPAVLADAGKDAAIGAYMVPIVLTAPVWVPFFLLTVKRGEFATH